MKIKDMKIRFRVVLQTTL